jgi:hypothetical protein
MGGESELGFRFRDRKGFGLSAPVEFLPIPASFPQRITALRVLFLPHGPLMYSLGQRYQNQGLSYPRSVMGKGSRWEAIWVGARWPVPPTEKRAQTSVDVGQSDARYCFSHRVSNDEERIISGLLQAVFRSTSYPPSCLLPFGVLVL